MVKKSERETSGMDGVRVSRDLMIRVNTLVDALDHHERRYGRRCKNKTQALGVVVLRGLEAFEAELGIQPEPPPIFAHHERKLPPADPTTDPSVEHARAGIEAATESTGWRDTIVKAEPKSGWRDTIVKVDDE
jgi:hypothetical protein